MTSLYHRQLTTMALVMLIAFLISSSGVMYGTRNSMNEEMHISTQKTAKFLGAFTAGYAESDTLSGEYYRGYLKSMALVSDAFIFVTELDGTVSYACDGENFYPIVRNDVSQAVVDELTLQGEFEGVSNLGGIFTEERYMYGVTYTTNVEGVGVPKGFVIVVPNTERLDTAWHWCDFRLFSGCYDGCFFIVRVLFYSCASKTPLRTGRCGTTFWARGIDGTIDGI